MAEATESKPTPGPWAVERVRYGTPHFTEPPLALVGPMGEFIAYFPNWGIEQAQQEANMRLLESSHDLLEACMLLVLNNIDEDEYYSDDHLLYSCRECEQSAEDDHEAIRHVPDCDVGKAAAAIAKARGAS